MRENFFFNFLFLKGVLFDSYIVSEAKDKKSKKKNKKKQRSF